MLHITEVLVIDDLGLGPLVSEDQIDLTRSSEAA
jgi:hypothetical protein